jgi:hypothetical protein
MTILLLMLTAMDNLHRMPVGTNADRVYCTGGLLAFWGIKLTCVSVLVLASSIIGCGVTGV